MKTTFINFTQINFMKKLLLLSVGLLSLNVAIAQIAVYGVTPNGFNPNNQAFEREYFYKYDVAENTINNIYQPQFGPLARATEGVAVVKRDGIYYSLTSYGGAHNAGQIFSYSDDDGEILVLHEFNPNSFSLPDEVIYGIAYHPASDRIFVSGSYSIYEFNPADNSLSILLNMNNVQGFDYISSPLYVNDADLYFTISNGTNSMISKMNSGQPVLEMVYEIPASPSGERLGFYQDKIVICKYDKITMYWPTLFYEQPLVSTQNNLTQGYNFQTPVIVGETMYFTANGGSQYQGLLLKYDFGSQQLSTVFTPTDLPNSGTNLSLNIIKIGDELLFTSINGNSPSQRKLFSHNLVSGNTTMKDSYNFAIYQSERIQYDAEENRLVAISSRGGLADRGSFYYYDLDEEMFELKASFEAATTELSSINLETVRIGTKIYASGNSQQFGAKGAIMVHDLITNETSKLTNLPLDLLWINSLKVFNDKLYFKATLADGSYNQVIMEYNPQNNSFQTLVDGSVTPFSGGTFTVHNGITYFHTTTHPGQDFGAILKVNAPLSTPEVIYGFQMEQNIGGSVMDMVFANNHLYFLTSNFESNFQGNILKLNLSNNTLTAVKSSMQIETDGGGYYTMTLVGNSIYGSSYGGANDKGAIYKVDLADDSFTLVHSFDGVTDADNSVQHLTQFNDKLYFVSLYKNMNGNDYEAGTLMTLNLSNNQVTVHTSFETLPGESWGSSVSVFDRCVLDTFETALSNGVLSINEIENANYEWVNCANPNTVLSTGIAFTPTVTGTYQVKATKSTCSFTSDCIAVTVSDDASILHHELSNIQLYPNPTSESINLNGLKAGMTIEIIDLSGKTILSSIAESETFNANVKHLNSGLYLVKIGNQGANKTLRFVVR